MLINWKIGIIPVICLISSFAFALDSINIAVGEKEVKNKHYPFIGVASNQGKSWSFPEMKLPADFKNLGQLTNTSCSNNYCAAIGWYVSNKGDYNYPPILIVSYDHGVTWDNASIQFPEVATSAYYHGVSCNHQRCVVVGNYYDNQTKNWPFILVGDNEGKVWNYAQITNFPSNTDFEFYGIDCNEKNSTAYGYYKDASKRKLPLILMSTYGDTTWTQASIFTPKPFDYAVILNVSCNSKVCLAGGVSNQASKNFQLPLILRSKDHGLTWSYTEIPKAPPEVTIDDGSFIHVKCNEAICFGVGSYGSSRYPLLIRSIDDGLTWTYPKYIISMAPETALYNSFEHVSCVGNFCVAAGGYLDEDEHLFSVPSLAFSQDAGLTWAYNYPKPKDWSPEGAGAGIIDGLVYDKNKCLVIGQYYNGQAVMPYVALSHDNGSTWNWPVDKKALPDDFEQGCFFKIDENGISASTLVNKLNRKKQFEMRALFLTPKNMRRTTI